DPDAFPDAAALRTRPGRNAPRVLRCWNRIERAPRAAARDQRFAATDRSSRTLELRAPLACARQRIHLDPLRKRFLCCWNVFAAAAPRAHCRVLQRARIRK